MKKIIKLQIDVEKDMRWIGMHGTIEITEMILTDFESLLDYDVVVEKVKEAIKAFKGFNMLSIYLLEKEDGGPDNTGNEIVAYRFLQDTSGTIKMARSNQQHHFKDWNDTGIKEVYVCIKALVETGNKRFIEIIKGK